MSGPPNNPTMSMSCGHSVVSVCSYASSVVLNVVYHGVVFVGRGGGFHCANANGLVEI